MTVSLTSLKEAPKVTLDLLAGSAEEAILQTAAGLSGHPAVSDFPGFCKDLLEREGMSSTAMGHGLAFPHARTRRTKEVVMAAGRCVKPVTFNGGQEVQLVFVLGAPPSGVAEYLALVAALTRRLRDAAIREALLAAGTEDEFRKVLIGEIAA